MNRLQDTYLTCWQFINQEEHYVRWVQWHRWFQNKLPTYRNVRLLKESNVEMLSSRLRDLDWTKVINCNGINTAHSIFHCIFTKIFNVCCPIIRMNANCKSNHKPWLTPSLLKTCKKKQNLYRVFLKCRSKETEAKYSVQT